LIRETLERITANVRAKRIAGSYYYDWDDKPIEFAVWRCGAITDAGKVLFGRSRARGARIIFGCRLADIPHWGREHFGPRAQPADRLAASLPKPKAPIGGESGLLAGGGFCGSSCTTLERVPVGWDRDTLETH
jgi:hypothetical protein